MTSRRRSPPDPVLENDELVQTRISGKAKSVLVGRARGGGMSVATYVRILIYRDLGLITDKESA